LTTPDLAFLERRRQIVIEHETAVARAVAARVVEKPALSAWMILIPIVFVHYLQRRQVFKRGVIEVSEELLRTRRRALEHACRQLSGDAGVQADAPSVEPDGRLRALRIAEEAEVRLLTRHYGRLLLGRGDDYGALLRSAYHDAAEYRALLDELTRCERAVSTAALEVVGDIEERAGLFQILAQARWDVRMAELKAAFGTRETRDAG
jgi:hypothetical protein